MVEAGIEEIQIVTDGRCCGELIRTLGDGRQFSIRKLCFAIQQTGTGPTEALAQAEQFAEGESVLVQFGDEMMHSESIKDAVREFKWNPVGAKMFLHTVADPNRFRIAEVAFGRIVSIEESPRLPKSDLALTGLGMFENSVFSKIRQLKERRRERVEQTDAAGIYLNESRLGYALL